MPIFRGLKASDRTEEEKKAIDQQMGYKEKPKQEEIKITPAKAPAKASTSIPKGAKLDTEKLETLGKIKPNADDSSALARAEAAAKLQKQLSIEKELYKQRDAALAKYKEKYGVWRNTVNSSVNEAFDKISKEASSHYKRYYGTDKLSEEDFKKKGQTKKELLAEYQSIKDTRGEAVAAYWLDKQFKNIVGENQSWFEQALNGAGHLIPTIEGGAIQLWGNIVGTFKPLAHLFDNDIDLPKNDNLSWWNNYWNNIIDNPITRYGRDVEQAGASNVVQGIGNLLGIMDESANDRIASMKATATEYNPNGIGSDAIITTEDQDNSLVSSATPWLGLQSGGFTALSTFVGGGLAKCSQFVFGKLVQGVNALNKANRLIKTEQALENTLTNIKHIQNITDIFVIPGLTGGTEGMMEGLNTKIQVEQESISNLNDFYREKVEKEVNAIWEKEKDNPETFTEVKDGDGNKRMVKTGGKTREQIYNEVWDKYKNEYTDARAQIEFAASKAGIQNMWANSLINGLINQTLKAGLHAPRVQESLRNSKLWGWTYRNPSFRVGADNAVHSTKGKAGTVLKLIKEPIGEGLEEFSQSLSNDTFVGAAENNINEFIKARFNGDSNVKVGQEFASDWGAAANAFFNSATSLESYQAAVLGAVSSALGTVAIPGGGKPAYHRGKDGKLVQNGFFDNFKRSLTKEGKKESISDYVARITPWRSSVISAYRERQREIDQADETAKALTEWLQDPDNRKKWDGLNGTAEWLSQMQRSAESNDQFSYRKAQMGKAINDVMMLSKLEGTPMYDAIITDLQRSASLDVSSQVGQSMVAKMRAADPEGTQNKSDEEILEKVQSNANKMLGIMSAAEKEGKRVESLLGRIDDDTKQSLVFGKLMEQDFRERKAQVEDDINRVKGNIQSSLVIGSGTTLDNDLKALIAKYGSIKHALKEHSSLQEKKAKAENKVKEIEAIDSSKRTEAQNKELEASKNEVKTLTKQLTAFDGLYERDSEGKVDRNLMKQGLKGIVLSEEEIMNLDYRTRAMMLLQGSNRAYNATHQNRQRVDELNQQIAEIQKKIDTLEKQKQQWLTSDGRTKKGYNKQLLRNNKAIKQLEKDKYKKERELSSESGDKSSKPIYSDAQQEIIDNLLQQGTAQDRGFLDKVVDLVRLEDGIKSYHTQYQAILSDPNAFAHYVQRAKANTAMDLTQRRAERISKIEDFKEFSKELDKLTANASDAEMMIIYDTLNKSNDKKKKAFAEQRARENVDRVLNDKQEGQLNIEENGEVFVEEGANSSEVLETNYDKYIKNQKKQSELVRQMSKSNTLTDNDMSLLLDAMQYLQQNGIDVTDREAVVEALLEKDELGNLGGVFRQWIEEKNSAMSEQQRAHMPVYTSIGQIVNQYVEILNGKEADDIDKSEANLVVGTPEEVGVTHTDERADIIVNPVETQDDTEGHKEEHKSAGIFDQLGNNSIDDGQFIDGEGNVSQGAAIAAEEKRKLVENESKEPKTDIEEAFANVTSSALAKKLNILDTVLEGMVFTEGEETSTITDEEKSLARQYLKDIAVNSDETFDTMEELVTAIEEKANEVRQQQDMATDKDSKTYSHVAEVLNSLASRLQVAGKHSTSKRPGKELSYRIHTADIDWMKIKSPDSWAVKFQEEHAIEPWVKNNNISPDTPIYFITDSEWTATVTSQMEDDKGQSTYDTLSDMPVVAAVEVETPSNPDTTTAIQVGEKWYQPVGIMPGTHSKAEGAGRVQDIRRKASKEQGVHLVTDNPANGKPIISYVIGKNYIDAGHPDASNVKRENTRENNTEVVSNILDMLPPSSNRRLRDMAERGEKKEVLEDSEYRETRAKVLNRLSWNEDKNCLEYTPDDLKNNEGKPSDRSAQPIRWFTKPIAETVARESDKSLTEVLQEGTSDDAVNFNSRTQGLFNSVIRPLFAPIALSTHADKSARLVTTQEEAEQEAERLATLLGGFQNTDETRGLKGINEYIYISPSSGWYIDVKAPSAKQVLDSDLSKCVNTYVVKLRNADSSSAEVNLGTITVTANNQNDAANIESAKEVVKNLLNECANGVLQDAAYWQVSKGTVNSLQHRDATTASRAKQDIGGMIDDGIFEMAGSSLEYHSFGILIKAPISIDGRIVYPIEKVANSNNAKASAPINNTPQGEHSIINNKGDQVDEKSGAVLEKGAKGKSEDSEISEKEAKAKAIAEKIVEDSKQFTLSEDETYYYIIDKDTGERVKYARVTSIVGADKSATQWYPSTNELSKQLGKPLSAKAAQALLKVVGSNTPQEELGSALSLLEKEGISQRDVEKALAELRTEHNKNKYGAWGTPSTALGNTADTITRDFFAGELKEHYPNISDAVRFHFISRLLAFKNDLEAKGIHIISQNIMAHGNLTITDKRGDKHNMNIAGTLDLFGYDTDGNFYIFDMKTTRDHTPAKLELERAKWSRQISMYADLLNQTYPDVKIAPENLRIIPINVYYATPRGEGYQGSPHGPVYSVDKDGQLKMTLRDGSIQDYLQEDPGNFEMRETELEEQFQPGYTHLKIKWDNLASQEQQLATTVEQQLKQVDGNSSLEKAEVQVYARPRSKVTDSLGDNSNLAESGKTVTAGAKAAPIVPNGQVLNTPPAWANLTEEQKNLLEGIDEKEYNEMLNDPENADILLQILSCS